MNLVEIYKRFPDKESCIKYLEKTRWNNKPTCPYCLSLRSSKIDSRWHCNACNTSYSVTVGTIFHNSKTDLTLWFFAISLIIHAKKGISSRQLARYLGISKNTAWMMQMRIRESMKEYSRMFAGIVELDETYIGGKEKNKHMKKRRLNSSGRNPDSKTPIFGMVERGGRVYARKVPNVSSQSLKPIIYDFVEIGSNIITDEWGSYQGLDQNFTHSRVNHSVGQYVIGEAHTNTIEGFWSLVKRGIMGQYHNITPKHTDAYLQEFCFRYNHRNDPFIFDETIKNALYGQGIKNRIKTRTPKVYF